MIGSLFASFAAYVRQPAADDLHLRSTGLHREGPCRSERVDRAEISVAGQHCHPKVNAEDPWSTTDEANNSDAGGTKRRL